MAENRIKELRKVRGISQSALANLLGVAQNTLSYWENGKYDIDNKSLSAMADYFGVSIDHILCRDQEISYALLEGGEHFRIDDATHREVMEFAGYAKEQKKAPSKDEADLVELTELFGKLTPENRTILLAAAKGLAQDK